VALRVRPARVVARCLNNRRCEYRPCRVISHNGSGRSAADAPCFPLRCGVIQHSPSSPRHGTHLRAESGMRSGVPASSATGIGTAAGS
jgi:hypothetical protein